MFERVSSLFRIFIWLFEYILALALAAAVVVTGLFNFPTLLTGAQNANAQLLHLISETVGKLVDGGEGQTGAQIEFLLRSISFENTLMFVELFLTILITVKVIRWKIETSI